MCKANAMSDEAGLGYSEADNAGTGTWTTGIGTIDDNRPQKAESKINIILLDKTNKISILISY